MKLIRLASRSQLFATLLLVLIVLGCTSTADRVGTGQEKSENVLTKMLRTKKLVVGYAGYPPYLRRDPATGAISGYSVDVITRIVQPLDVQIEWRETTWDNMKQDLLLGKFDLMIEPIFITIPRAAQVGYTNPYAYFGYGVPIVRKNDKRFQQMQDFNSPSVTLAVTQGVTDQEYAVRHLPHARLKLIPGNDISITLTEVLTGKADAALADVPTVVTFLQTHPKEVKALFLENPPATTPAGFMLRQDQLEFLNFLNSALLMLETQGVFDELETKYALPSFREKKTWTVGKGLPH
jgi:cyclohexadienyl dehydratase